MRRGVLALLVLVAGCDQLFGIHDLAHGDASATDAAATTKPDANTCSATQVDCDGLASNGCEVDFESDGANCGGCGHSCGGDACSAGLCEVKTYFHSNNAFTQNLALYDGFVLWTEADSGAIDYAPIDGSNSPALAAKSPASPFGVMADSDGYYWFDINGGPNGFAFRCTSLECSTPQVLASTPTLSASTSPHAGAMDATSLYWHTSAATPAVSSVLKSGGPIAIVAQGDDNGANGMVVMGGNVYFTECCGTNNGLYEVPAGGGTAVQIETQLGRKIVSFGSTIYGVDLDGNLQAVDANGNEVAIDTGGMRLGVVGVDASGIYVASDDSGIIGRLPANGGPIIEIAAATGVEQLVFDDSYVYWTENAAGGVDAVRRVHK